LQKLRKIDRDKENIVGFLKNELRESHLLIREKEKIIRENPAFEVNLYTNEFDEREAELQAQLLVVETEYKSIKIDLEEKLARWNTEREELNKQIEIVRAERRVSEQLWKENEEELRHTTGELKESKELNLQLQNEVAELKSENQELKREVKRYKEDLGLSEQKLVELLAELISAGKDKADIAEKARMLDLLLDAAKNAYNLGERKSVHLQVLLSLLSVLPLAYISKRLSISTKTLWKWKVHHEEQKTYPGTIPGSGAPPDKEKEPSTRNANLTFEEIEIKNHKNENSELSN